MTGFVRSLGAVLLGIVVGVVVIMAMEGFSSLAYPLPEGVDPADPESLAAYMPLMPVGAFLIVLVGWGLAALVGGWIASRLAFSRPVLSGLIAGAVLLLGGVVNMVSLSHPWWFVTVAVPLFPLCALLGASAAVRSRPVRGKMQLL